MRHRGAVVDVEQRRVCDRDGEWYPFDRLEVAGTTLYYARPLNFRVLKYHERWLIADEGWSVSRFQFTPNEPDPVDWYIEMELIDVEGALWTVRRLDDADELGDGLADGSISVDEAARDLRSLDRLCDVLHQNGNSGAAILARYAPDLPH